MKFRCQRKEFADTLRIVMKAVDSKPEMPLLSGVYIEAKENSLEFQTTDNETGFICRIKAETIEQGKTVLAGKYLYDVTAKLPGNDFDFSYDKETNLATIKSANANFTLLGMEAEQYPTIDKLKDEEGVTFTVANNNLVNAIKKTAFASSDDESRPLFMGCLMEIEGNKLTMVATNSHRMAIKHEKINEEIEKFRTVIPAKVLNDLSQIIVSDLPYDIKVNCTNKKVGFTFGDNYMFSRIIGGDYPEYKRVVPPEERAKVKVLVKSEDFLRAMERVSLISRTNDFNTVKMEFIGDSITVTSNNPLIGKAEEKVHATIEGSDIVIAFNAQYMIDVLKIADAEDIEIKLETPTSPLTIRELNDDSFLYVSTPVRNNN